MTAESGAATLPFQGGTPQRRRGPNRPSRFGLSGRLYRGAVQRRPAEQEKMNIESMAERLRSVYSHAPDGG
jgi:hypothetical protein